MPLRIEVPKNRTAIRTRPMFRSSSVPKYQKKKMLIATQKLKYKLANGQVANRQI